MNNDLVWSALKFILYPRHTTVFDLERLVRYCKAPPKKIISAEFKYSDDPYCRLTQLTIARFRPLIKRRGKKILVTKDDVSFWADNTFRLIETLMEINVVDFARALARSFMSVYFYMLTIYALWSDASIPSPPFMHKGEFEEGALEFLLEIISSPRFRKILEDLDIIDEFMFSLSAYAISLSVPLELSEKKKGLRKKLREILVFRDSVESVLDRVEEVELKRPESLRYVASDILYLVGNIVRTAIPEAKDVKNSLIKSLDKLYRKMSEQEYTYRDLVWETTKEIVLAIRHLLNSDMESSIKILEKIGEHILKEKLKGLKISERITLRVLPETQALLPFLVSVPINLADNITAISVNHLLNDLVNEVLGSYLESKMVFSTILSMDSSEISDFIRKSMESPLSSVLLIQIFGAPSAWILETALMVAGIDEGKKRKIIPKALEVLLDYLGSIIDITKKLIEGPLNFGVGRKIGCAHLLREVTFLSYRLTEEVSNVIKTMPQGKKFLNLVEEATELIDKIYKQRKITREEEEKIEELII